MLTLLPLAAMASDVFQRLATVVALETMRRALSGCDKGPLSVAIDLIQER
jgi:hypothetical protein